MDYAVLFPGQGSQAVGMAADVLTDRPDLLGPAANDLLGWDLAGTILTGPEELLTRTDRAQPSLYGTAYALWEAFAAAMDRPPAAAAGHSLGEYTALAAAGVIDYWEGLTLVAARGAAMAHAAAANPSSMAALIGADAALAEEIASARRADGGRLWLANHNAPGQVVVAGGIEDIEWLVATARDLGVRRAVPLKVAGGFHSPLMAAAAAELEATLAGVTMRPGAFPVYSNVTARPAADVAASLEEQLTSPVRFEETLESMAAAGVGAFVHVGPGDVTAGLARRTLPDAAVHVVSSLEQATAVAASLALQ